jgi:hypothetical protein
MQAYGGAVHAYMDPANGDDDYVAMTNAVP